MNELILKGKKHPVFFDFLAIERISESVNQNSLDETAKSLNNLSQTLKFAREVAYHGICGGYREIGESCPFQSSEHLAESVKKYSEIAPAINIYTASISEFYHSEDSKGEAVGAKIVAP